MCIRLQYCQFTNIQFVIKKSFPDYISFLTTVSLGITSFFGDDFSGKGIKIGTLGCYVTISSSVLAMSKEALDRFQCLI